MSDTIIRGFEELLGEYEKTREAADKAWTKYWNHKDHESSTAQKWYSRYCLSNDDLAHLEHQIIEYIRDDCFTIRDFINENLPKSKDS